MAAVLERPDDCELQPIVYAPMALAGTPYRGLDVSEYTLSSSQPDWLSGALTAIARLGRLAPGWDSYSAKRISPATQAASIALLREIATYNVPAPSVVPVCDGSIQIEWHTRGIDLELNVISSSRTAVLFEDSRGAEPLVDEELRYDMRKLTNVLDLLASRAD